MLFRALVELREGDSVIPADVDPCKMSRFVGELMYVPDMAAVLLSFFCNPEGAHRR